MALLDHPFQYSFLDESLGKMHAAEQRLGKAFTVFVVFAIIIDYLALFTLTISNRMFKIFYLILSYLN